MGDNADEALAVFAWTSRQGKSGSLLKKACGDVVSWELSLEKFQYYVDPSTLRQKWCWSCYHIIKDEATHHFGFVLGSTGHGKFIVDGAVMEEFEAPDFQDCVGSVT